MHTHALKHTHTHKHMYTHKNACKSMHTNTHTHTQKHTHTHTKAHTHMHTRTIIYAPCTCTCAHTHTHACTHTHTHTQSVYAIPYTDLEILGYHQRRYWPSIFLTSQTRIACTQTEAHSIEIVISLNVCTLTRGIHLVALKCGLPIL